LVMSKVKLAALRWIRYAWKECGPTPFACYTLAFAL